MWGMWGHLWGHVCGHMWGHMGPHKVMCGHMGHARSRGVTCGRVGSRAVAWGHVRGALLVEHDRERLDGADLAEHARRARARLQPDGGRALRRRL
eukprot:5530880-Prymnesium_polylepis.1